MCVCCFTLHTFYIMSLCINKSSSEMTFRNTTNTFIAMLVQKLLHITFYLGVYLNNHDLSIQYALLMVHNFLCHRLYVRRQD